MHLRMVFPSYPWTRALEAGRVRISGVTYECAPHIENAPDRFDAFAAGAYDVGEDGVRRFVAERLKGAPPTALPIFFDREHSQRNIFVRADSPLTHPRELVGKRVGSRLSPHSGTGAAVLMMLEQAYEVPLREIKLRMGNPQTLPSNRMGLDLAPAPLTDRENLDLLVRGEVDAVISNLEGRYWSLFGPDILDHESFLPQGIRPLIADPATIAATYRRTGLYPITDVVVVRPELLREDPELPAKLMGACSQANALAVDYRSAIEEQLARSELELLGADPHVCGLTENARRNLAAFIDFSYRVGALEGVIEPEELFAPSAQS